MQWQRDAQLLNKQWFDRKHQLWPRKIEDSDWVIVYDSSLVHQYNTIRKFSRRWFGPYEVRKVRDNGINQLSKLDGTLLRTPVTEKWVMVFKKREEAESYVDLDEAETTEEVGISEVEELEDNDSGIELMIELTDSTNNED